MQRGSRRAKSRTAEQVWSSELSKRAPLDRETTMQLFRARDDATPEQLKKIDELILEGNLRLVMKIARKYDRSGHQLLDLVQDGCGGVLRAIQKFDWRRDVSFPTYATWWIRQAVAHSARTTGRDVRLPAHAVSALRELGREESGAASVADRKSSDVVMDAVKHVRREVSLSAPARAGADSKSATVGDNLPDGASDPEQLLGAAELRRAVELGVADLTEPELIALRMRFGLAPSGEESSGDA